MKPSMTYKFLFDTYAIIEILKGNKNYQKYEPSEIVITNFIFAELSYILYREKDPLAENYLTKYAHHITSVNPEWIQEAMQFRLAWKDRKVSITDCVGYIMARKLGIPFLTGDKEFENLEDVEFVK